MSNTLDGLALSVTSATSRHMPHHGRIREGLLRPIVQKMQAGIAWAAVHIIIHPKVYKTQTALHGQRCRPLFVRPCTKKKKGPTMSHGVMVLSWITGAMIGITVAKQPAT